MIVMKKHSPATPTKDVADGDRVGGQDAAASAHERAVGPAAAVVRPSAEREAHLLTIWGGGNQIYRFGFKKLQSFNINIGPLTI
jgi:hypothetical protein